MVPAIAALLLLLQLAASQAQNTSDPCVPAGNYGYADLLAQVKEWED